MYKSHITFKHVIVKIFTVSFSQSSFYFNVFFEVVRINLIRYNAGFETYWRLLNFFSSYYYRSQLEIILRRDLSCLRVDVLAHDYSVVITTLLPATRCHGWYCFHLVSLCVWVCLIMVKCGPQNEHFARLLCLPVTTAMAGHDFTLWVCVSWQYTVLETPFVVEHRSDFGYFCLVFICLSVDRFLVSVTASK